MRAVLIINPISGDTTPNAEKIPAIREHLAPAGFELEVALTTENRPARQLAREAVEAGVGVILVGGGDGTVSEVARELVLTPATLGVIPIGTFNNIARSLAIPPEIPAACEIIKAGHTRMIDVGQANGSHYFFEAAGAGLDAAVFPLGEELKGGRWTRIWEIFRLTWGYTPHRFNISFDRPIAQALAPGSHRPRQARNPHRRLLKRNALFVVAANGPYYGGGFAVAPGARISDGLLTLTIYRRFGKTELLRHFRSIAGGRRVYSPKIETFHAAELTIDGPSPAPAHADGVPIGQTPLHLRVVPQALRVFAPAQSAVA